MSHLTSTGSSNSRRRCGAAAVLAITALLTACSAGPGGGHDSMTTMTPPAASPSDGTSSMTMPSASPSAGMSMGGSSPMHGMSGMPGMSGEHHADLGKGLLESEDGFTLKPASRSLALGRQTISFTILDSSGHAVTDFVQEQTKYLHMYLLRADLSGYQHLHPRLQGGVWSISTAVDQPGPYRLYTDFVARGAGGEPHAVVLSTELVASGRYQPTPLPSPSTSSTVDGLTATLSGRLSADAESRVVVRVTSGGRPVSDLQPYLDAYAHLTAVHVGDLAYQHVHPQLTAAAGRSGGPYLPFSVMLPEKGMWRLFLQVQRAGKLELLAFTVYVM